MLRAALLAVCLLAVAPAAAQDDSDLSRIPGAVENAPPASASPPTHGKYFVEDALGVFSYRGTFAVAYPYGVPSRWANRTSFDMLDQWKLATDLTATFSDRLSATFADGVQFPDDVLRNDPREAYLTWEPLPQAYLEAGRINVRNGVAFGYNPTDFFRTRTTVSQSSADPGALRENRLGTMMVRAERIFDGGTIDVVYAPKLHTPAPLGAPANPLDPKFDQTNGADRFLAAFSFELEEFSPQLLVYHDSGRTKFGLNASHPIGNSIIAYLTWAGGVAPNEIADAIAFGKRTATLPASIPVLPPTSTARAFRNDVSAGAYWTGEDKITVSLEYNYHQAGFSKRDWRNWFAVGADPASASELWFIRGYASDQQDPMSQHQAFARVDWSEPFQIEHFDVNGFVMTSLEDGSCLAQFAAGYDISDAWSVGAYVGGSTGGRSSEWGSLRNAASATIQLVRYF